MGQYYRYCANCLISENNGGAHCCIKEKDIAESTAKHINHCKDYELVQCAEKRVYGFLYGEYLYSAEEKERKHD